MPAAKERFKKGPRRTREKSSGTKEVMAKHNADNAADRLYYDRAASAARLVFTAQSFANPAGNRVTSGIRDRPDNMYGIKHHWVTITHKEDLQSSLCVIVRYFYTVITKRQVPYIISMS